MRDEELGDRLAAFLPHSIWPLLAAEPRHTRLEGCVLFADLAGGHVEPNTLTLRVQDVDFASNQILVRDGKGGKDRVTMLPESLRGELRDHLKRVAALHRRDLSEGWGRVVLPEALAPKYPNASAEWRWVGSH